MTTAGSDQVRLGRDLLNLKFLSLNLQVLVKVNSNHQVDNLGDMFLCHFT